MNCKKDIDALLSRSTNDLQKIERGYNSSLHAREIAADLRIDIKNYCENLRSVLDYLAHDIRKTYCPNASPKVRFYFPILHNKEQYESKVGSWYPGLKETSLELWRYLESAQPYNNTYQWIGQFNFINNENKHRNLIPQIRNETKQVRVTSTRVNASWRPANVKFGPGASIGGVPIDPKTQMPVPHPSQKVERIIWVDFRFAGMDISALQLLKQALSGITLIATDLEKLIGA